MDLILLIRLMFVVASASLLLVKSIPVLSDRILTYGFRGSPIATEVEQEANDKSRHGGHGDSPSSPSSPSNLMGVIEKIRIPHAWMTWYSWSISLSLLWASQLLFKTSALHSMAAGIESGPSMSLHQVIIAWLMMLLQGGRRLYETLEFVEPTSARMWVVHWALGIWFYMLMSMSIWIEGIPNLLAEDFSVSHFRFTAPSLRTFVATLLFILASGIQHDCHAYLASLKKYSLPTHPVFNRLVCPHYFAESLIYLSLAIVTAPAGEMVNRTVLCGLVFVVVNLGLTADGTKKWYEDKFGKESVALRWRMIPFLY